MEQTEGHNHEHTHFKARFRTIPALQNFFANPKTQASLIKTAVTSFVVSIIAMFFISKFTGLVSYAIIAAYLYLVAMAAFKMKQKINGYEARDISELNDHDRQGLEQSIQYLYYVFYFILAVMATSLTILACFWKKIRLAIKCIKSSGKYMLRNPLLVLIPIKSFAMFLSIIGAAVMYAAMKI
jgi:Ca2+/Na+ antiporter